MVVQERTNDTATDTMVLVVVVVDGVEKLVAVEWVLLLNLPLILLLEGGDYSAVRGRKWRT